MVDRYWRKIESVENDIENAMQISSILLKLKGYDDKLSDLSKIGDNDNNISSNLSKIRDNENNISSNLSKINNNETNISFNLSKVGNNENNIDEIKSDLSNIDFNSNNKYSIENFFIYNIEIENDYTLNKDNPEFSIFNYTLEDDFKSNSILEFNCKLLYDYTTYNNIGALMHAFKIYDENDTLLHEYKNLKSNSGDNHIDNLTQIDLFYIKLNDNYSIIKIESVLSILDIITKSVSCKLYNSLRSNFLCIKHYKKINSISVNNNLGDLENTILSNKNDISTNLSEIDYLKNNISKSYLKNIYSVIFYNEKIPIDFGNLFYEKMFEVNAKENDFIEMRFKIDLEYEDISGRNYIKTICQLFDENNNSLCIKSVANNEYFYFSNRVIIDENIFYNFTNDVKKIKFVIRFQNISFSRVIKIFYIKNDNHRLVIKNYGL